MMLLNGRNGRDGRAEVLWRDGELGQRILTLEFRRCIAEAVAPTDSDSDSDSVTGSPVQ